jgi:chromatin assembly factor 1 subunit A
MVVIPQSNAFAAMSRSANVPPAPKKAKLTFQEKEMKRIQKEIKEQERAAEKAKKEAERLAYAEEKARKDAEKEAERLAHAEEKARKDAEKEAERLAHAEEKARKDAEKEAERKKKEAEKEEKRREVEREKAAKEEKRKKREEEKLKAEELKRKKERSQLKLGNFFAIPPTKDRQRAGSVDSVGKGRSSMSPAPQGSNPSLLSVSSPAAAPTPTKATPGKPKKSEYERLFPDFYVKDGVSLAPINRFERDEGAVASIQDTIDSYILGNRSPGRERPFDTESLFHLSSYANVPRGKRPMPVRDIMTDFYSGGNSSRPIDLTTDSQAQNSQAKRMGDSLRKIPMKFLKFQEDVRPPYRGTYTSRPITGMSKLARNPLRRDLPNTNYDYDSEAEWIEDDEDAEDLMSEGDNDKEEDDGDEDMDGFLDDENDETAPSKRSALMGDLEPVSTGLCWEDRRKRNTNVKLIPYRMEIILGKPPFRILCFLALESHANLFLGTDPSIKSIDPFSNSYWAPAPSVTTMEPPRIPLNTIKNTSVNFNTSSAISKPVKQFFTPASEVLKSQSSSPVLLGLPPQLQAQPPKNKDTKLKKLLADSDMDAFKQAIDGSDLSKVGLIEVLKKKFPGRPAASIKATLEVVARREGKKEVEKRWALIGDVAAPLF